MFCIYLVNPDGDIEPVLLDPFAYVAKEAGNVDEHVVDAEKECIISVI